MNKLLRTIVVDLTPVLPGGENGGAKVFVLELLRRLAEIAPRTQFVLLTHAATDQELSLLDCPNMRRLLVVGLPENESARQSLPDLLFRIGSYLPGRLIAALRHLDHRVISTLRALRARSLLRGLNADLLFVPFTAPFYYASGIPTVCTIYDLQYRAYPEFFTIEDLSHRNRAFTEACRVASALAAISNYVRDSAIAHGSVDPTRIRTIYLRLAQRIASVGKHDYGVLRRLGLPMERYLIYPANFWKHKNHERLIAAFDLATHGRMATDVKLVCTGSPGKRQGELIDVVRTMGLGERVLFPGYLSDADLGVLMASSRGVVFPSLYEGFGLPVLEAMAAGIPVACSNTTALSEVVAKAAIFFDPYVPAQIADAMVTLVGNVAQRDRLIRAGRQRALEFSDSERMAREYWELFLYAHDNATASQHVW